jgi:hypothetical protein
MPAGEKRGKDISVPDPSWKGLYAAGSLSALVYVILVIIPLVLVFAVPQPFTGGGAALLGYIASNKIAYLVELICFVGLSIPALVVFLALPLALKHLDRNLAAIGALLGIASEVIALAVGSSPQSLHGGLVLLSDQFAAAGSEAQRVAFSTAAEGLMASTNAVSWAGILTAAAILVLSLAMRKGLFHKAVAWIGIVTGALGIVSEALRPLAGMGYIVYGLLLPAWFVMVGLKLFALRR